MQSRIIGLINPVNYNPDFFESPPYPIQYFDNKEIKILFIEPKIDEYLSEADNVLERFLQLDNDVRKQDSPLVRKYYQEVLNSGYTQPLELRDDSDIWKFVSPSEIIIEWDEHGDFYLCVSCACDWEEEHGLQLVFKNGEKLTRASGHDGGFVDE